MTPKVEPLDQAARVSLALAAAALMTILVVARCLQPDPRGHGTHQQLGLPACAFQALSGEPCPACGLTTAFAWVVRGRFDRALAANPAGCLLAPACAALVPWLLACSFAGRPLGGARTMHGPLVLLTVAVSALAVAAWTVRLVLGRVLG